MDKKGHLHLSYMISGTIFIVSIAFAIWLLLTSTQLETEGFRTTELRLGEMSIFNKIITSRNCLSTGETGVLNETLLNESNQTTSEELACAFLPKFGHLVIVDNLTNGEGWDWEFGYNNSKLIGQYKYFDLPVAIKNHNGTESTPGRMRLGIISDDLSLICSMVEEAWMTLDTGQRIKIAKTFSSGSSFVTFHYKGNEICLEYADHEKVCKKLQYAETVSDSMQHKKTHVCFQKKDIGGEIKIEPSEC